MAVSTLTGYHCTARDFGNAGRPHTIVLLIVALEKAGFVNGDRAIAARTTFAGSLAFTGRVAHDMASGVCLPAREWRTVRVIKRPPDLVESELDPRFR